MNHRPRRPSPIPIGVLLAALVFLCLLAAPAAATADAPPDDPTDLAATNGSVDAIVLFDDTNATDPDTDSTSLAAATALELDATPGVTVKRTFWIVDAALVTIDTDITPVDTLVADPIVDDAVADTRIELRTEPTMTVDAPSPTAPSTTAPSQTAPSTTAPSQTAPSTTAPSQTAPSTTGSDPLVSTVPTAAEPDLATTDTVYGVSQVRAPLVWDHYGTGVNATVAVLDSGVDPDHDDIDLYTDDPDDPTYPGGWAEFDPDDAERIDGSQPFDPDGHGTHVSGTATGGNASGTAIGVAPDTRLIHGKVAHDGGGTISQALAGMEWALENDADVISMSLGGVSTSIWIPAVETANEEGALVVAAAGNDGEGTSISPGNLHSVVGVGAVDADRDVAFFSAGESIDTETRWGDAAPDDWPDTYLVPDVTAAGVAVLSAEAGTTDGYVEKPGTSMATPNVAGIAALIRSSGAHDVDELTEALTVAALHPDGDDAPQDTRYGHGVVDAFGATMYANDDGALAGTVTTDAGDPVAGATVSAGGVTATTDADGQYLLVTDAGSNVTVTTTTAEFGDDTGSVSVERGSENTHDVTLRNDFDVEITDRPPATVTAGDSVELRAAVSNVDSVNVSVRSRTTADVERLSPSVNDETATFGVPVEFQAVSDDDFAVRIDTAADSVGTLQYEVVFSGDDDDVSHVETVTIEPEQPAVTIPDQTTDGTAIRVGAAFGEEPFSVALYENDGGEPGARLGTSETMSAGSVHEHVVVRPDEPIDEESAVLVGLCVDDAVVSADEEPVLDAADLTVVDQHESRVSYRTYYAVTDGDPRLRAGDVTQAIGALIDGNEINDVRVRASEVTRLIGYLIDG